MPANYAHYRFGKQVLATLPADVRQCIQRFRRMYDMGLHGPDIFFYYNPFLKTAVGDLGETFHRQTGQEFFARVCAKADSEAARAYLYGLLGHYCLDSHCHPFVQKMDSSGEAGHVALESEFDRYLMAMDGIAAPHTHDLTRHMKLTRGECMTVAEFYPPATGANISRSVRFMAFAVKFLANKDRERTEKLLKKIKPSVCDNMIPEEPVAAFARMDSELLARYNRAVKAYPGLLAQITAHRKTGEPLGEDFAPDFG
ncbi:MAG: zinc dependent phospholipase C family protein [Oscillospiraceae bacterium]|nr:zinc dependent phospholipase C family protein [Oscillospiraceae bacterium]